MNQTVTRAEHLAWCKERALEYCARGEVQGALMSMISDLGKHPETDPAKEMAMTLGMSLFMNGHLSDQTKMAHFINGFR